MIPCWTRRGLIDLADLKSEDLTAEELGEAMSKINRFGGRTPEPWSVAAHSVLVELLCPPDLKPWALLHDAHKVFLGDLTDPAVELLCRSGTRTAVENAIGNAEGAIDRRIAAAWGVAVRSMSGTLRAVDQIVFLAEAWTFLGAKPGALPPADADLLDRAMSCLADMSIFDDWRTARDCWLARVEFLSKAGAVSPPRSTDPTCVVQAG